MLFGLGAVLMFINFLSLRQAVTPARMLGRMTSTMRWLILLPAAPGALIGGWLGEHVDLRASLAFSGVCGLVLTVDRVAQPDAALDPRAAGAVRCPRPKAAPNSSAPDAGMKKPSDARALRRLVWRHGEVRGCRSARRCDGAVPGPAGPARPRPSSRTSRVRARPITLTLSSDAAVRVIGARGR